MILSRALNGTVVNFADEGPAEAPTLVFANSLGTDLRIWAHLLAHLPAEWRTLRYDKRGHGLTAGGPEAWTMDDLVDDVALLMEDMEAAPAVVVGLSVGGLIAIGLAHARPDLVRGVVLCDTAARIGTEAMWNDRIARVREGGMAAVVDATMEKWFTPAFRDDAEKIAPWRAMLARTDPAGYLATCAAIRDADWRDRAAALGRPALAVVGEADGSTPPEVVRDLAETVPGCGFETIAGAGHIPCVERPEALATAIRRFVASL